MKNQGYIYNEHDENQVQEILKKRKLKKRKKRRRRIAVAIVILLIIGFFVSDFSKIQSIEVSGNQLVNSDDVINELSVKTKKSFTLFTSSSSVEDEVEKMNFVDKAKVSKSLFGNIKITITETQPIAYGIIDNVLYIVDNKGDVQEDKDQQWLSYVQRCSKMNNFDKDSLKQFAKHFAAISSVVQNKVSDINFAPIDNDKDRCEFLLDDDKVFYVRYNEMEDQLTSDNYARIMSERPNFKYYDFLGLHVYTSN